MQDNESAQAPEMIDNRTEEGAHRSAELLNGTSPEANTETTLDSPAPAPVPTVPRRKRTEPEMILDQLSELNARVTKYIAETAYNSSEAALERGEVITKAEAERLVKSALSNYKAELRKLTAE